MHLWPNRWFRRSLSGSLGITNATSSCPIKLVRRVEGEMALGGHGEVEMVWPKRRSAVRDYSCRGFTPNCGRESGIPVKSKV